VDSILAFKEIAVKKYVVRLSKEERAKLQELIRKDKSSAKQQLKARILLKADVYDDSGKLRGPHQQAKSITRLSHPVAT
jgi:hypothetical protein